MIQHEDVIPIERIESKIYFFQGKKVMIDSDLAELYGVKIGALNQAVKRNRDRFPPDFAIQLSADEYEILRSQIVILKSGRGAHRKYLPSAFTEQGVAMLSSVLKSKMAVHVNIAIMRTFVRLREIMLTHKHLAHKIDTIEKKYDHQFKVVFDAIRQLMEPPQKPKRLIGFGRN